MIEGTRVSATDNFDSFDSLVADVASALDAAIPAWRVRLSAAAEAAAGMPPAVRRAGSVR